jgi:hypothetical protein
MDWFINLWKAVETPGPAQNMSFLVLKKTERIFIYPPNFEIHEKCYHKVCENSLLYFPYNKRR